MALFSSPQNRHQSFPKLSKCEMRRRELATPAAFFLGQTDQNQGCRDFSTHSEVFGTGVSPHRAAFGAGIPGLTVLAICLRVPSPWIGHAAPIVNCYWILSFMSATCPVTVPISSPKRRALASLSLKGALALSIRIFGAAGMLLCQIVLAKSLGVVGFGEYSQMVAWIQFLCIFGKLGLDNSSLRFVSEYTTTGDHETLAGFIRESSRASLLASVGISAVMILSVRAFRSSIGESLADCISIGCLMIPFISLRQIQEAAIRGLGLVMQSQISFVVWPFTLLTMAFLVWKVAPEHVSSSETAALHLIAVCVVSTMVYLFFRQSNLKSTTQATSSTARSLWWKTATAFLAAELLIALKSRVCVAIAGATMGSDSAGVYAAMERFSDAALLGAQSLGLIIAPEFASLFAAGRYADVRRLMRRGQLLALASTLPVAFAIAGIGPILFDLLGDGFQRGWTVLLALLASACITSIGGPAGLVLQMTGRERTMLAIIAACATSNVLLSLILVSPLGIVGFGIAQIVTSIVWTVGVLYSLRGHAAWQTSATQTTSTPNQIATEEAP